MVMTILETCLPRCRSQAIRQVSAWLPLVVLALGPGRVQAATYEGIDCPNAIATLASDINDRGDISGICENDAGEHGFLLRNGEFTLIDFPGATNGTLVTSINNRGDVAGFYRDDADVRHGFLLRKGRYTTIDPPGSEYTAVEGIDDLGRLVGFYCDAVDCRGFVRDARGFRDIVFPESGGTGAWDINVLGRIVGGYYDPDGSHFHGFVLKNGTYRSINYPGASGTRALGINVFGHIVGNWSADPECSDCFTKAFLLTPRGFKALRFPHADETFAADINSLGQIVGNYFVAEGEEGEGTVHGFVRYPNDD
jgi:uncharacterized membrane protein